ncbi:MAG: DNA/RNA nuclease SfsA [Armatimonadota bacterium]|nr:DNA/RNA nuclease SfsA [Armatimonadota bacterium]MDR5703751.1 DNA/RNA nuclease SfsA [Armatimonadota bacterium]
MRASEQPGATLIIPGPLYPATFLKRPNKFLAIAQIGKRRVEAFLPNPGRMRELFVPGVEIILREIDLEGRKTRYDVVLVRYHGYLVSADSRLPSKVVHAALREGALPEFAGAVRIIPEARYQNARLDFLLEFPKGHPLCLLEVKSCNLVENGRALFPDAPTKRGVRHLEALIQARRSGLRACVVFLIQRPDSVVFSPYDEADPEFGRALREAVQEGVEAYAYDAELSLLNPSGKGDRWGAYSVTIQRRIPVEL